MNGYPHAHQSYWQKGCDDARAGMENQWKEKYAAEVERMHLTGSQKSSLEWGYHNGHTHGKYTPAK